MHGEARLLTPPRNYAVVQLPRRQFPGVVFQGDSLNSMIKRLESAASEKDPAEKAAILAEVLEQLTPIRRNYERVLKEAGIRVPYF